MGSPGSWGGRIGRFVFPVFGQDPDPGRDNFRDPPLFAVLFPGPGPQFSFDGDQIAFLGRHRRESLGDLDNGMPVRLRHPLSVDLLVSLRCQRYPGEDRSLLRKANLRILPDPADQKDFVHCFLL